MHYTDAIKSKLFYLFQNVVQVIKRKCEGNNFALRLPKEAILFIDCLYP